MILVGGKKIAPFKEWRNCNFHYSLINAEMLMAQP